MVDSAGRLSHRGGRATADSAKQVAAQLQNVSTSQTGACVGGLLVAAALAFFVNRDVTHALRKGVQELGDAAQQVAGSASQVSESAQALARRASEQAASLEETSASSEQINAMASQDAQNSKSAADTMVEASRRVCEANRNLEQMVVSMDEINASSDKISKIIRVIDESLPNQHSGAECGGGSDALAKRGWHSAVMADEVRNLAQRCAQAAKDTSGLIEESVAKAKGGKTKLQPVATAMRSITESAGKVKTLVDQVKLGSEEQAGGFKQIAKAIAQMEQVAQSTAAQAEESSAASSELSAQAQAINLVVLRLRAMITGDNESAG